MSNLSFIDIVVIGLYFLLLAAIAWWAAKREKNVSADFFLASRDVGWLAVGASLFASNIGSEHLVGLAGTGAASGLAVGHFEWLASFILLLLGWLFVPFYLRSGVYTMPEFLERRYNSGSRAYFTWVSIVGYVLTKISVTLFAGGIVMRAVTAFDFWTSAAILIVITGLYTIFGGLRAVIYTAALQAAFLVLCSVTLTFIRLHAVAGGAGRAERRQAARPWRSGGGASELARPARRRAIGAASMGRLAPGSPACSWWAASSRPRTVDGEPGVILWAPVWLRGVCRELP